jgi:hypothetical protein
VLRADSQLIEVAVLIKELGNVLGELGVADPDFVRLRHFYLRVRIFRRCRSPLGCSFDKNKIVPLMALSWFGLAGSV